MLPGPSNEPSRHFAHVTLLTTSRGFEAETIALALRERGIEARAIDMPPGDVLSSYPAKPRVVVPEHAAHEARRILDEIQQEASRIDWSAVDVDEAGVAAAQDAAPKRGVMLTAVLLVPLGLGTLAAGNHWADPTLQVIGAAVLLAAGIVLFGAMISGSRK